MSDRDFSVDFAGEEASNTNHPEFDTESISENGTQDNLPSTPPIKKKRTFDLTHVENLSRLCRICGGTLLSGTTYCYPVVGWEAKLESTFSLKLNCENVNIHPLKFCRKCHASISNKETRGSVSTLVPVIWKPHVDPCDICTVRPKGGRPPKSKHRGRPKVIKSITDIKSWDGKTSLPPSLEAEMEKVVGHYMSVKMKNSDLPGNAVQLNTGGPQKLTLTPVTVPRKESDQVSKRTIQLRTKKTKELVKMVSGGSTEAMAIQYSHLVKGLDETTREKILEGFNSTISVPEKDVAAMKADLSLPWNRMRDLRRWLKTFKIGLASESKCRDVTKEWVGSGVKVEQIPASVMKLKKLVIELRPWVYLFNLVGFVLKYLNDLKKCSLLIDHLGIPENEIHLKVGGDHGQGSFKMCFQIVNVRNPNQPANTVVFSMMEAKDYRSNLLLCLERFKSHIFHFSKVSWEGKLFRLFMFGDYEFLCAMYGISGPSGRHCCLWCDITYSEMQKKPSDRVQVCESRTLDLLDEQLNIFQDKYKGNLTHAKLCYNVIAPRFFDIPLNQVCIPGLHITLGVVKKVVEMIEKFCSVLDLKIAAKNVMLSDEQFDENFEHYTEITKLNAKKLELEKRRAGLLDEIHVFALNNAAVDQNSCDAVLEQIDEEINAVDAKLEHLLTKDLLFDHKNGACFVSIDQTLKSIGVDRQAYYGGQMVGNHCHTLLKERNISIFCDSIPAVLLKSNGTGDLYTSSVKGCNDFKHLLNLYSKCDKVFNSASYLTDETIEKLSIDIKEFMSFFRLTWPNDSIPPKMHMLEDHMIPFLSKWHYACGMYGEQGGESIHQSIKSTQRSFNNQRDGQKRLELIFNNHLAASNPEARSLRVVKKTRKTKRN